MNDQEKIKADPFQLGFIATGVVVFAALVAAGFAMFAGKQPVSSTEPKEPPEKTGKKPFDAEGFKEKMSAAREKKRAAQDAETTKITKPAAT